MAASRLLLTAAPAALVMALVSRLWAVPQGASRPPPAPPPFPVTVTVSALSPGGTASHPLACVSFFLVNRGPRRVTALVRVGHGAPSRWETLSLPPGAIRLLHVTVSWTHPAPPLIVRVGHRQRAVPLLPGSGPGLPEP